MFVHIPPNWFASIMAHGTGELNAVPTFWIILGFVGQSVTAVNLLTEGAIVTFGTEYAEGLLLFALIYGFIMMGFGLLWACLALSLTIHALRQNMPFSLTWWSFAFPVGTCATGLSGLARHTGLIAVEALALLFFTGLVGAWLIVASRTFHGSVIRGTLFNPPPQS